MCKWQYVEDFIVFFGVEEIGVMLEFFLDDVLLFGVVKKSSFWVSENEFVLVFGVFLVGRV